MDRTDQFENIRNKNIVARIEDDTKLLSHVNEDTLITDAEWRG